MPSLVKRKLDRIGNPVVVGVGLRISGERLRRGEFKHVGIALDSDGLRFEVSVLPSALMGPWSTTNLDGRVVTRRDLPMVEKTFTMYTPNYGDYSRGVHEVSQVRRVYPTELIPAKQSSISVEGLGHEQFPGIYAFRFRVEDVLDKNAETFDDDLLYDLNLLQENVGSVDVFESESTAEDYMRTLYVEWELLPPGSGDEALSEIIAGGRRLNPKERQLLKERYEVLESLQPQSFVVGKSGFRRYWGATIQEDLVVFENIEYGNALYIMGENWEQLSRMSRTDLLKTMQRDNFTRIPHIDGWKHRLRAEIRERRRHKARQ